MKELVVNSLKLYYRTRRGTVRAVDEISFKLGRGETLSIVGESGCGKSSTAYALMRILPRNVEEFSGSVKLDGEELLDMDEETFRKKIRWKRISMVFQGAMNALNPVMKIGYQIAEPLMVHEGMDKSEALKAAAKVLKDVLLPEDVMEKYQHQLSGGMKQRVVIAMAIIMNPDIVILDEPTSALDVIVQANLMNLLKKLKWERGLSYIFITHDLSLASELSDRLAVMYAGKIVEIGTAEDIYKDPLHPYTNLLISSVPTLRSEKTLKHIPGSPPDLVNPPQGCRFMPRCPYAKKVCNEAPTMIRMEDGRYVMCHLYG